MAVKNSNPAFGIFGGIRYYKSDYYERRLFFAKLALFLGLILLRRMLSTPHKQRKGSAVISQRGSPMQLAAQLPIGGATNVVPAILPASNVTDLPVIPSVRQGLYPWAREFKPTKADIDGFLRRILHLAS